MVSFVAVLRLLAQMVPTFWELSWPLFIAENSGYFWQLLKLGNAKVVYQPHEGRGGSNMDSTSTRKR
ncbi:unnamed protein product [Prunus armeniaca]